MYFETVSKDSPLYSELPFSKDFAYYLSCLRRKPTDFPDYVQQMNYFDKLIHYKEPSVPWKCVH